MKKIIFTVLALACTAAFATEGHGQQPGTQQKQQQQQEQTSVSSSVAAAQNAGNSQVITVAPVTTNVASDLAKQGQNAAAITGKAQIEIAKILTGSNSNTSGVPGVQATATGDRPALTNAELRALVDIEVARLQKVGTTDIGSTAAATQAAAAIEVAKIQSGSAGDRDLNADQRAALDREAAIEIARLGQTVKNTPSIGLGQLTSSNDTCMGSVSVGGSGPGFSVGIGTTYTDDNCKMLKNSRELWNMGMKAASLALMCTNAANREALEITGFECPQTAKARKDAEAAAKAEADKAAAAKKTAGYTGADPIVQARLGLTQ